MASGLMFTGHRIHTHLFKLWGTVDRKGAGGRRQQEYPGGVVVGLFALVTIIAALATGYATAQTLAGPSKSSTIALTSDNRRVVVANRDSNSVSIIRVRNAQGADSFEKLAEVEVEQEPRYVALHPDDSEAYVTNTASGSVSVIALTGPRAFTVVDRIPLGLDNTEPRGIAITPNGTRLYVACHTGGTILVINPNTRNILDTVSDPRLVNPTAIAITNDGDGNDGDERVFVSDFFAKLIPGGPGEGFDNGKRGAVFTFPVNNPNNVQRININPLNNSGFTANRAPFCPDGNPNLHDPIFCPDVNAPIDSPEITADLQGAFPNQLLSLLIRGNFLYVPSIGAAPEPPVRFNVNVQGLVNVVNRSTLTDVAARRVNLNAQVATEPPSTAGLNRTFLNDLVDVDATLDQEIFLFVSRGGDYVMKASLSGGVLDIGAPNDVVRYRTGHLPTGVVASTDGRRAYTNNEVGMSVTAINLINDSVIRRDIPSSTPPEPGTSEYFVQMGKLAFFTALGIPNNDFFNTPIREINTVANRGKASVDAWSGCGSCHPDGLADGVTWLFDTGPRQTIPLDAFFAKDTPSNQRISNYSGVRSSNTEFNQNSVAVQGGDGFVDDPTVVFNHGPSVDVSDAWDVMTLWVQTVRPPILPLQGSLSSRSAGRTVFRDNCASCHGGSKWTKSQVIYANNPVLIAPGGAPRDENLTLITGQIAAYDDPFDPQPPLDLLVRVGTFDPDNPLELRGLGLQGQTALGADGYNVPSVLGICYHAPFFHNGSAQTLFQVFQRHRLPQFSGRPTIAQRLNATQEQNLFNYLCSIDGSSIHLRNETDRFLRLFGEPGPSLPATNAEPLTSNEADDLLAGADE